jgi:hypothetical protein
MLRWGGSSVNRQKLRELREHLDFVDDRFSHRLRATGSSLVRPGPEELERRQRVFADFVIELKDTLQQLLALLAEENGDGRTDAGDEAAREE